MGRLTILFLFLLGLVAGGFLALHFHAPGYVERERVEAASMFDQVDGLAGRVDLQYSFLQPTLFGYVDTPELREKAASLVLYANPATDPAQLVNHIRTRSNFHLPKEKQALQKEIFGRFKDLPFESGRFELGFAAEKNLRSMADRILETDPAMPLLLVSYGHDDKTVELGIKRAEYVRSTLARFGVPMAQMGVICRRRSAPAGDASVEDPLDADEFKLVQCLILE